MLKSFFLVMKKKDIYEKKLFHLNFIQFLSIFSMSFKHITNVCFKNKFKNIFKARPPKLKHFQCHKNQTSNKQAFPISVKFDH